MGHNSGESIMAAVSLHSAEDSFNSRGNHSGCSPNGATIGVNAGVEAMSHTDSSKILVAEKFTPKRIPVTFAACMLAVPALEFCYKFKNS